MKHFIFRPWMPPSSFTIFTRRSLPLATDPQGAAGPVCGPHWPSLISLSSKPGLGAAFARMETRKTAHKTVTATATFFIHSLLLLGYGSQPLYQVPFSFRKVKL